MKEFRKIAIGLLGLTHPELFVPRPEASTLAGPSAKAAPSPGSPGPKTSGARFLRAFRFFFAALAIGSRTVPLADHGDLVRELRSQAGLLYGPERS